MKPSTRDPESSGAPQRSGIWLTLLCGVLLSATLLNYADRQALPVTAVRVKAELHFNNEQYGRVEGIFGLAFGAGALVSGILADWISVRWLYPALVLLWSSAGFVTGGAETLAALWASRLALGTDVCNSARGMMLALGCIQARRCNANDCPVGVATQKPGLVAGLDVESKGERVRNYHNETVAALLELLGAAGLEHPDQLSARHINRRTGPTEVRTYADIYDYLERGALLADPVPAPYERIWSECSGEHFMAPSP